MIEAQERHEKSPRKVTTPEARCGSSGGTPHMFLVTVKGELHIQCNGFKAQYYFNAEIQQCCLEMSRNQISGCTGPLYTHSFL